MSAIGKVVDATVLVGGAVVGIGAVKAIVGGVKLKSGATIALGTITLLISIYAIREAVNKINE